MNLIESISLDDRLISPEQAVKLKELDFQQTSYYAFQKVGSEYNIVFERGDPLQLHDWATEKNCYAAFDITDLMYIMYDLGYYLCGRTRYVHDAAEEFVEPEFKWWADTATNAMELTGESMYVKYGPTPARAMCEMLLYTMDKGLYPGAWRMLNRGRLTRAIIEPDKNKN